VKSNNKTLLSSILSILPNKLKEIAKLEVESQEKAKTALASFINKISSKALSTVDNSGKSALDYLLEYKEDNSNILSQLSKFISDYALNISQFLQTLTEPDNLFKLDAKNWPVLSYFRLEQWKKVGVEQDKEYSTIIFSTIAGSYDRDTYLLDFLQNKEGNEEALLTVVNFIISKGANVNIADSERFTPLHCAAVKGYQKVAHALLKAGANQDAVNVYKNTPLHNDATKNHLGILNDLILAEANIEAKNSHGHTPLHQAAYMGFLDVVELLIRQGANVNATDRNGNTALHLATTEGCTEIVKILLLNQAIPNLPLKIDIIKDTSIIELINIAQLIHKIINNRAITNDVSKVIKNIASQYDNFIVDLFKNTLAKNLKNLNYNFNIVKHNIKQCESYFSQEIVNKLKSCIDQDQFQMANDVPSSLSIENQSRENIDTANNLDAATNTNNDNLDFESSKSNDNLSSLSISNLGAMSSYDDH
jgi:ankyrin repeat protein